jgi:hypothetical protein
MRIIIHALACVGLCAAFAVHAGAPQSDKASALRYKWRDGQGLPHYSDSLSTEALKYGYDVVDARGITVGHVERQLTPEERIAARKVADQRAAADAVAQEQHRADMQMLNAYPDEASFASAKQAELDNLDGAAKTIRISLQTQEKALSDLLTRAGDLERAKQPMPPYITERINEQRNIVASLHARLDRLQVTRADAQKKADADLKHYRELRVAQQQQNGG